ncbi:aspartate ammonia-lyase [Alicyclobacillus sp. SO9]|uniref:aspartate ammonia-lyase n=1 Tax=Alicyclobacillus sp. SO9 TaxID=2665646 RepID=UPI0018E7EE20|nr:aspartate ammonia-lyase [Alicyclobacillus sp. SO9]QQE80301.1 aspartate ammonia-lyase [Alicyclobacillus sp. SO9]
MEQQPMRTAHDSLGELQIPAEAYYGAQTARAIQNFPISGLHLQPAFVRAQAILKWAAAKAHKDLGVMDGQKTEAICHAAEEVMSGKLDEWFQVDVYQAGAGTSQNMNVNEVIASRAAEFLGGQRGDYSRVHPNDDVNKSQSTNDTIHAAMQVAGIELLAHQLDPALGELIQSLEDKARAFNHIVKSGRTHLQDAVPMRLGDEFAAFADNIRRHRRWLEQSAASLLEIGLGGNAIGTGINTPEGYAQTVVEYVAQFTGLSFRLPDNPFTFNQNPDEVVFVSGAVRSLSLALQRIANDLRLLSSGPRTGLGELNLPAVQPGSSIMPGKVNPVMAEMLNMTCYQVQGCDTTVAQAGGAGQLELNVMMPVMAANFLHEISILSESVRVFSDKCIRGIEANEAQCTFYAENTLSLATALNVELGYEQAAKIVKEALAKDISLREAANNLEIPEHLVNKALDIEKLSRVVPRGAGNARPSTYGNPGQNAKTRQPATTSQRFEPESGD